jgi:hypothetical protein
MVLSLRYIKNMARIEPKCLELGLCLIVVFQKERLQNNPTLEKSTTSAGTV